MRSVNQPCDEGLHVLIAEGCGCVQPCPRAEIGPLAPVLDDGLHKRGLPVVGLDARHVKNATTVMPAKSD